VLSFPVESRNFEWPLCLVLPPFRRILVRNRRIPHLRRAVAAAVATALVAICAPALARAGDNNDGQRGNNGDRASAFVPQNLLAAAAAHPAQVFEVIVTGNAGRTSRELENQDLRDAGGRSLGDVTRRYNVIDAVAVDLRGAYIVRLAKSGAVRSIVPDAPVISSSFSPAELWPSVVGVDRLWETPGPLGTVLPGPKAPAIAIVDSGVDATRLDDFGARVRAQVNIAGGANVDENGHGTMVAGVAAGGSSTYPGAAPNADVVSLRVVARDGSARTSDVIAAADWIYANRIAYGIGVANFSLHSGNPDYALEDPLARAVRRLWLTGTVVVAAAGNEGPQRMLYAPASDPFVITVGAVGTNGTGSTDDDTAAPWSSFGKTAEGFQKPELSAPGRMIAGPLVPGSTIAQNFADRVVAPGYVWMSGTSFSAPIVSGVAAQLLARNPTWTPDQVKGALMLTARNLPAAAETLADGVGEIDAAAAASVVNPPNPNEGLNEFVRTDVTGERSFDTAAWKARVAIDASWVSASWVSASWVSASWVSASWVSASWVSASWVSSAFADASWVSASWVSSSTAAASWVSANTLE
jgi:serine protease AprX